MSNKARQVVAIYQRYFDEQISREEDAKDRCCRLLREIAEAAEGGRSKKDWFQEKADQFSHFEPEHRREFDRWPEDAFDRLFEAFKLILKNPRPLSDCRPPKEVIDARFRWVNRPDEETNITYRSLELEAGEPPLVLVTVFDPRP